METQNQLKIFFIVISFIEAFFMGMLPVKVKRCRNSLTALGIANAFAGGVFIAISLLHIMPEQVMAWRQITCNKWLVSNDANSMENCPEEYPLPFLLIVLGYTLILLFDKVVFDAHAFLNSNETGQCDQQDIMRRSLTKA